MKKGGGWCTPALQNALIYLKDNDNTPGQRE
jgi:hypothetical protein